MKLSVFHGLNEHRLLEDLHSKLASIAILVQIKDGSDKLLEAHHTMLAFLPYADLVKDTKDYPETSQ